MLRFVGFYKKFCRPLSISLDYTLETTKDAFLLKFPEVKTMDRILIQVLDAELGEFLDWDKETRLAAGSKIKASQLTPHEQTPPPVASTSEVPEPPPVVQESSSSMLDPRNYVFPPTPKDILHNLSKVQPKSGVSAKLRRRITEWMCFDLFRYTLYPAKLYEHAARQLVLRHTILQDTIGNGHGTWHRALRFKCEFERSKFVNDGEIASTREKFGRHAAKQDAANGLESAKRVCRQDDYSIEGRIKSMQREMGKESPDTDKLLDGLTRTFAARRHWIVKERPSAQEILQRFPALERAEEIFLEFQRFGGKSPVQTITVVAQEEMDTALDVASKKVDKFTYEILERADTRSEEDRQLVTTLALLVTLPRAVREKSSSFFQNTENLYYWALQHCCNNVNMQEKN
ncbi:sterile alpha motif domain-containing protein 3-like [Ixodes scapularis]|uniref:sterile alpha motif domain-containing protein 3-like n=1 Tax=Ixodes scapularis TaxID=6945 RepID=UPI001C382AB0|nr:sterile alpha motif domain-containing protein 3-like [Ixodes scapularis]